MVKLIHLLFTFTVPVGLIYQGYLTGRDGAILLVACLIVYYNTEGD